MIPYDDLVTALSAWRARQGLPVNTMGGSGSGPTANAGSGPHHAAPIEAAEEVLDESAYEQEGNDYGYQAHQEVEPTAIGDAPERPTEADLDDRNDW